MITFQNLIVQICPGKFIKIVFLVRMLYSADEYANLSSFLKYVSYQKCYIQLAEYENLLKNSICK